MKKNRCVCNTQSLVGDASAFWARACSTFRYLKMLFHSIIESVIVSLSIDVIYVNGGPICSSRPFFSLSYLKFLLLLFKLQFLFFWFLIFCLDPFVEVLFIFNFIIQFKLMVLCFSIWFLLFWFLIFSLALL